MRTRIALAAALIGAAALVSFGPAHAQRATKPADPITVMMQEERARHKATMADLKQQQAKLRGAARVTRLEAELEAARAGKPAKGAKPAAAKLDTSGESRS